MNLESEAAKARQQGAGKFAVGVGGLLALGLATPVTAHLLDLTQSPPAGCDGEAVGLLGLSLSALYVLLFKSLLVVLRHGLGELVLGRNQSFPGYDPYHSLSASARRWLDPWPIVVSSALIGCVVGLFALLTTSIDWAGTDSVVIGTVLAAVAGFLGRKAIRGEQVDRQGYVAEEIAARAREAEDEDELYELLVQLEQHFPQTSAASESFGRFIDHEAPSARLVSARALGRAGRRTLLDLVDDSDLEEWLRLEAFEALVEESVVIVDGRLETELSVGSIGDAPEARWRAVLAEHFEALLLDPSHDVRRLALAWLCLNECHDALAAMQDMIVTSNDATRADLARCLAGLGADAEPLLVELLAVGGLDVRKAVASSLAIVGSPASIDALRDIRDAKLDGSDAAAEAIRQIRARHGISGSSGALSMAGDSSGGELSVAGVGGGELALGDED